MLTLMLRCKGVKGEEGRWWSRWQPEPTASAQEIVVQYVCKDGGMELSVPRRTSIRFSHGR